MIIANLSRNLFSIDKFHVHITLTAIASHINRDVAATSTQYNFALKMVQNSACF